MSNATAQRPAPRRTAGWPRRRTGRVLGAALLVLLGGTACSLDGLLNSDALPKNVSDPAITKTPDGARAAYYGALSQFRSAFGGEQNVAQFGVVGTTGLLSDELLTTNDLYSVDEIDQRTIVEGANLGANPYSALQKVRGQAGQAIGLLTRYVPEQPALAAHLYALQGYAEIFLAELYCSGIPLSTLDFDGDFTYHAGSSTEAVFAHAVALFDTALALGVDSARFVNLARVGQARALLGVGEYAAAAAAAATVPDGYDYDVTYTNATTIDPGGGILRWGNFARAYGQLWQLTVSDVEGGNGLDYRTSGDPRSQTTLQGTTSTTRIPIYRPTKYSDTAGADPIVLASGVEARLVEAEAALKASPDNGQWLTKLNALRTDGTFDVDTQVVAVDNSVVPPDTTFAYDTLWHTGTGGVAGLAPLDDPGTPAARVDLLFRERAFWLFLTGHRQGDLRRLIRQYGRLESEVYPVGSYLSGFPYGSDVTLPVPTTEFVNPLYIGCTSRGA